MKKKIIIFALVLTILGVGIANNSRVFAQNTKPNPFSSLVQIISDKFGLNKNDVQSIFDQYTLQLRQNRGQKMIDKTKKQVGSISSTGKNNYCSRTVYIRRTGSSQDQIQLG